MRLDYVLACAVLAIHVLFILWVIFGVACTRRRPLLRGLHIVSLAWGVWIELSPWPCPLTLVENWFEFRSGRGSYQGGFLLHYLDSLVYPDVPPGLLTAAAVMVAIINFGIYVQRFRTGRL